MSEEDNRFRQYVCPKAFEILFLLEAQLKSLTAESAEIAEDEKFCLLSLFQSFTLRSLQPLRLNSFLMGFQPNP
jgi:hypothetical protein